MNLALAVYQILLLSKLLSLLCSNHAIAFRDRMLVLQSDTLRSTPTSLANAFL